MKMIFKTALMAATIAGAMSFVPTLANAQIGITLNSAGRGRVTDLAVRAMALALKATTHMKATITTIPSTSTDSGIMGPIAGV